jgi:hypothetical protein
MDEKEKLKGIPGFDQQETVGVSPWLLSVLDELGTDRNALAAARTDRAEDIAACVLYTIAQPKRCDVVHLQIRPHLLEI